MTKILCELNLNTKEFESQRLLQPFPVVRWSGLLLLSLSILRIEGPGADDFVLLPMLQHVFSAERHIIAITAIHCQPEVRPDVVADRLVST